METYVSKSEWDLPKKLSAFFWHFIKKQPVAFTLFFLAPIAMVLETTVFPYALKMIVDGLTTQQNNRSAAFLAVAPALWLGGGAWVISVSIIRLQNWWQGYVIPKFQAQVRMSVFSYLSRHSYYYFSNQMAGSLANKVNDLPRSLETIRMIISWNIIATFSAILASLLVLITINVWFAVILLTWVIIQFSISLYFARNINHYSEENAEDKSELSGRIVDTLGNIGTVKLFARTHDELEYLTKSQKREAKSNKKLIIYMNVFRLFLDIPVTIMLGLTVFLLIVFWQHQLISTGDLVFIFSSVLSIMTQMWMLSHAMADLFREIGIAKQALSLIMTPIEVTDVKNAKQLQVTEGRIAFENVSFHYQKGNRVFQNKSVIIHPQERVGLVGYSGSGKTTFINLILRFFDVEAGRILIDGQDISLVTQDSLRAAISMIPQDPTLFHRSLFENIAFGHLNATEEQVINAAQQAHCHEFITNLPQGYETLVGERGIKLSGGQRQRIAIARAILKNAKVLILDEATSQLDSLTEESIQASLFELMRNKTTLVIAHRLSTLLHMDRILVFDKGIIVEEGSHKDLIKQGGLYKAMWDAQIGGFLPEKRNASPSN
ncbi:ABC transporter ATP-binding protein [Legionella hackeliae]|uniref:ABC transporter ATP binding protein n=1 Tax=Legionella hackeliae TaxID=449 RepID=A0A0A8UV79_LEGHA|nr:ABC transporter ATP-binding protein [Legionella hackeliae]KTD09666.1 ABC transporter ATP-binding protein [Legionella hackeliae]CEK11017.1 ABC transporter ATP binding protein [Legionella hackeliae]STX47759.1 ABC transporter ATP-binding protein [Legionella hackeliae]